MIHRDKLISCAIARGKARLMYTYEFMTAQARRSVQITFRGSSARILDDSYSVCFSLYFYR